MALLLAACAANPAPAPAPEVPASAEAAWSAWTEPVNGVSCRFSLPARVRRGDRVSAVLALRFDAASRLPGVKYFDAGHLDERVRLLLRNWDTGRTAEVGIHDYVRVLETPVLEEPGQEGQAKRERVVPPDWIPLDGAPAKEWPFRFRLAKAWEVVTPGTWEARVALEEEPRADAPDLRAGTATTAPQPLVVEEAPLRRIRARVPAAFHLRADPGFGDGIEITNRDGPTEVVDIEARNGFLLGCRVDVPGSGGVCGYGADLEEGEDYDSGWSGMSMTAGPDGAFDRTCEASVFEYVSDEEDLFGVEFGRNGYRTLWRRSFRVTATAGEVEALRRGTAAPPR